MLLFILNLSVVITLYDVYNVFIWQDIIQNLIEPQPQFRYQYQYQLQSVVFYLSSLSLSISLSHSFSLMYAHLGCKVFQNGRTVHCRSSAYSTMTRGSVFQMPMNSAYGKLQ